MPIDERTTRFGLELPAQANTLKNDVNRLRDAMNGLDAKAAMLDDKGKVKSEQLQGIVPLLDDEGAIKHENLPGNVVLLEPGETTLTDRQIPPHLLRQTYSVAQETLITDLDAKIGDIVTITSSMRMFELKAVPASNRDNWKELVQVGITKLNGQPLLASTFNGDLKVAEAGVNTNITQLTGLSGPLKLGGKGQSGYDAVTFDQLVGAVGTSGGASLSGVMNDFIGAVEWFNGDRTTIPSGYIPADGQLVSRTDPKTKDLWTAVEKGMFAKVSDAEWVAGPNPSAGSQYRGKYSTGDGKTTFRVPDLNGIQLNSIRALFLRGDGGGQSVQTIGTVGEVLGSAAPNIFGAIASAGTGIFQPNYSNGVFTTGNRDYNDAAAGTPNAASNIASIDASKASPVYGRKNANLADGANEVRPNSVNGIWLIRANGSFQAADTEFNVISSEAVEPPSNTTLHGGIIKSRLNVAGKTRVAASNYANFIWGSAGGTASHNLDVIAYNEDGTLAGNATYMFSANGLLTLPNGGILTNRRGTSFNLGAKSGMVAITYGDMQDTFASGISLQGSSHEGWNGGVSYGSFVAKRGSNNTWPWPCISVSLHDDNIDGCNWQFQHGVGSGAGNWDASGSTADAVNKANLSISTNNEVAPKLGAFAKTVAWNPTCDSRLKREISDVSGEQALENIQKMQPVTFAYQWDTQGRVRRGFIAQQLEAIDKDYTQQASGFLTLDSNTLLLDALAAIKVLAARVTELEAKLES
ncbi:tail fiber domain-containing protein [Enterobacter hormaechei]|nr:tail fiber domain-containing protein [Enterobacter hormaechei]